MHGFYITDYIYSDRRRLPRTAVAPPSAADAAATLTAPPPRLLRLLLLRGEVVVVALLLACLLRELFSVLARDPAPGPPEEPVVVCRPEER